MKDKSDEIRKTERDIPEQKYWFNESYGKKYNEIKLREAKLTEFPLYDYEVNLVQRHIATNSEALTDRIMKENWIMMETYLNHAIKAKVFVHDRVKIRSLQQKWILDENKSQKRLKWIRKN